MKNGQEISKNVEKLFSYVKKILVCLFKTTSQRFELWRAEPNRFLIYLLNHSDMMSSL